MPTLTAAQIVTIPAGAARLEGLLRIPRHPRGLVIFAHGSGSGRRSPRNVSVAAALNEAGLATLLFDLLTADEAGDRRLVFDIPFLATRLRAAAHWARESRTVGALPLGYFGASTGAGAALVAAAGDRDIAAIVSRGGRPDLAGEALPLVTAPTLLIVGGADDAVLDLNRAAHRHLTCEKQLAVVPGAGHLFEEPGAMDAVIALARAWFVRHCGAPLAAREERS